MENSCETNSLTIDQLEELAETKLVQASRLFRKGSLEPNYRLRQTLFLSANQLIREADNLNAQALRRLERHTNDNTTNGDTSREVRRQSVQSVRSAAQRSSNKLVFFR